MTGNKIGVEMSQEYVFDFEGVLGGERDVLVRVALGVNDGGRACRFVSYQVGSVRQARQIELFENHFGFSSDAASYFGWGTIRK
jgi:hypothetical protein